MKEISVFGFYGDIYFTIITITLLLLYWHFTRTFGYWRDRNMFYLEPTILFGNLKNRILLRQSFHELQLEMYAAMSGHKYGGIFEGRRPTLLLRDPELIKHVMVRDFDSFVDRPSLRFRRPAYIGNMLISLKGQRWKSVRALLTPTFSSGKLKVMETLVASCGHQMAAYLEAHGANGSDIEMKEFFGRFTLEVIASCAFGVSGDSLKDPDSKFVKTAARFNAMPLAERMLFFSVILFAPFLAPLLPVSVFNREAIAYLVALVQETTEHRRQNPASRRNDFLQLVLDASEKDPDILDSDTIVAQSLLFLIAGFETTATLLTFASYELALNPEVQRRLRAETLQVLSRHHGILTYDALSEMHYLEAVLFETLRKHPPVARVDRVCTRDYLLPGTEVTLAKGMVVGIPVIGLHYDPQHFPDPQRFDPERFGDGKPANVFLPFGAGPRNCIGARFAVMSAKVAMATLVKGFEVTTCERTSVPYEQGKRSMLLQARDGIWLRVAKRDTA